MAVVRIPVEIVEDLLDLPEGVRLQEARIIDDHFELLVGGQYHTGEGEAVTLAGNEWFAATYDVAGPGVRTLRDLVPLDEV